MPDETGSPPGDSALIAAYRQAVHNRTNARRTVGVLILLIVVVYLSLIWNTISVFRERGLPEFSATLGAEVSAYLPEASDQVRAMLDRVVPIYMQAFNNTFERDKEKYSEVLLTEFEKLKEYAIARTPAMEEALAQLVLDQEQAGHEALTEIMSEDQFEEVALAYQTAFRRQMHEMLNKHLEEHVMTAGNIIDKLQTLAKIEPPPPTGDSQYLMGQVVELLGLEMQDASLDDLILNQNP